MKILKTEFAIKKVKSWLSDSCCYMVWINTSRVPTQPSINKLYSFITILEMPKRNIACIQYFCFNRWHADHRQTFQINLATLAVLQNYFKSFYENSLTKLQTTHQVRWKRVVLSLRKHVVITLKLKDSVIQLPW